MTERTAIYLTSKAKTGYLENGEWDFHDEDTQQHLHALHPYPARFIPQIPRKAISIWSQPGDLVLDPFCGCGTTMLESILLGRPTIGVDNNPVAILVSQAKTVHYSFEDLGILEKFVKELDCSLSSHMEFTALIPEYENIRYWFCDESINDLARLRAAINRLPEKPRLLTLAVFSSIIVRVSNQDSDTRYTRIEKTYHLGNATEWFKVRLIDVIERLKLIIELPKATATIYCADSRNLGFIPDGSINLIVTSPPYINAYDYHKYHRHRIQWIGGDVSFARDNEIGKHDTFTRPNATPARYFDDMQKCFKEWKRVLIPGGHAFIVIGDGIVSGKPVPVGDKFIELCEDIGLKFSKRWIRSLQKNKKSFNQHARIDKEHLLLLEKVGEG